jgi:peptide deformylase
MSLRIVHYDDSILRKKGEKIVSFDPALAKLAGDMLAAMHEVGGIGLAAQQVGIARQLCVVDLRESDDGFDWELDGRHPPRELFMPLIIANPRVTALASIPLTVHEEGCLSFPSIRGEVTRPEEITVRYQDEHGLPHVLVCNGLLARCIQHEADHLQGKLFIDRMDKKARAVIEPAIKALAKQTKAEANQS